MDDAGHPVFSKKMVNVESEILGLLAAVCDLAYKVVRAVDLTSAGRTAAGNAGRARPGPALLRRATNRMPGIYKGGGAKTEAKTLTRSPTRADAPRLAEGHQPADTPEKSSHHPSDITKAW